MKKNVVIVNAVRLGIGSFLGSLSDTPYTQLGGAAINQLLKRTGFSGKIDEVIMGNIVGTDPKGNPAREAALDGGVPIEVPAFSVNKNCASGLKSIALGALQIRHSESKVIIAGGMENMSRIPYVNRELRKGNRMGDMRMEDLMTGLLVGMGMTAERLAEQYSITREEQDEFALLSQQRAAKARAEGRFTEQIAAVTVKKRKEEVLFSEDEGIKENATMEGLARLRAVFKKDGTVTAGNSSTINDGAAALLLMDEDMAKDLGLTPLARILGWASAGVDPDIMGIGPVPAIKEVLKKTGLSLSDVDILELNEAFAAQSLAVLREIDLPMEKVNPFGGAIALGHPTGATGAILTTKLVYALRDLDKQVGLVSLCIGGGQGLAMAVERV